MRKVLIYGDSNSYGSAPMPALTAYPVHGRAQRWGDVMARALGDAWEVIIEGLPGRTTVHDDPIEGAYRNGLTVLPAILHSHAPIDDLVICLGANDHKMRFGLSAQDIAMGVGRLVREARASETAQRIVVVCPPPLRERGVLAEMFKGAETRCAGLADHMAEIAMREGAVFFDAGSVISVDNLDGVHWDKAAHETLGQAMAEVLRAPG